MEQREPLEDAAGLEDRLHCILAWQTFPHEPVHDGQPAVQRPQIVRGTGIDVFLLSDQIQCAGLRSNPVGRELEAAPGHIASRRHRMPSLLPRDGRGRTTVSKSRKMV